MQSLEEMRVFGRIAVTDYLFALLLSFPLFAVTWAFAAPGHLYYCWDDAPPFMVSWYPPFIHPWANSSDGNLVDMYLVPGWLVYLAWFFFVAGAFLLPAIYAWRRGGRSF
jgi:hypothetical protein